MLTNTECDVRFATHARQINRVSTTEWQYNATEQTPCTSLRARLAGLLVAVASRIAPVQPAGMADPTLAGGSQA